MMYDERFQELKRACLVLTLYGVQPRYPYEMGIEQSDMLKAVEYACQIRDAEPIKQLRRQQ